jgi:hypothetical protein
MVSKPRKKLTTPEAEAMGVVEASREWERELAAHDSYEVWCEGDHDATWCSPSHLPPGARGNARPYRSTHCATSPLATVTVG